ncbi:MAG: carbonate dehydratase [Gammaproteobacteria bacterium]
MKTLKRLFDNNQQWAERIWQQDPEFFAKLAAQQGPEYLWIGCSDSRVPANQIVGLLPGEVFVHRNVGNVVLHADLNCLSVLQFAIDVLKVRHVIVCGHYGCGGVRAAYQGDRLGLVDNWLRHVQDVAQKHHCMIDKIPDMPARLNRLCELNVEEQVANVCHTTVLQDAWARGQNVTVHGWIYGLANGLLRDLEVGGSSAAEFEDAHQKRAAVYLKP